MNALLIYGGAALAGVVVGPIALRVLLGLAPGSLKERAAKWQLHRALRMGNGWLVHQTGDRSYQLTHIETDDDSAEIGGEEVDLSNVGHITTKTGSVPMGVSYGPEAVDESRLVGVSPDTHIDERPMPDGGDDDD